MRSLRVVLCVLVVSTSAWAAGTLSWPMRGRDISNTGRADFSIPPERLNSSFFDIFLWQKRTPNSPHEGNLSATAMVFYDGAGPDGVDVVVGGYHWPKGVQGMDRHTGALLWSGNPGGGESIGRNSAAFSNDGTVIYVTNDATESDEFPQGHPLMAFSTTGGPGSYWHNGADSAPNHMGSFSPCVAPDGRIFLHSWVDRPYAATDNGSALTEVWAAATSADCGLSSPVLYDDGNQLMVVIGARWGAVYAYDGATGAQLFATPVNATVDAPVTIDPSNGNIYVAAGSDHIYFVGLNKYGQPLWGLPSYRVYEYIDGVNAPQRAQAGGCLSYDGATYYFQTNNFEGHGQLFAVNTDSGSLKWTFATGSTGWEMFSSSPIVTPDGVVIVGNNQGGTYYAIRDAGASGELIDTLAVDSGGNAEASATLSSDGLLYLPLRVVQTAGTPDEIPTQTVQNLFTAIDLRPEAQVQIWPPTNQSVVPGNNSATLTWTPIVDSTGQFDHYAIYRDIAPFTSVAELTPIGTVAAISTGTYIDNTAVNNTAYYYAVTCVSTSGGEITAINSVGPCTPRDETDLQVVTISRTPRYPRYDAQYTYWEVTEPSGFGPYVFSAATGLGSGQTPGTQRWPNIGDPVDYRVTVRNRGTNTWSPAIHATYRVDGQVAAQHIQTITLAPGELGYFPFTLNWDGQDHEIQFSIDDADARPANNTLSMHTKSVAFLSFIDKTYYENFRASTANYPDAVTDDLIDWLNRHMTRFNQMFAAAHCGKRVHFDVLEMLADADPDPASHNIDFAIFPFRYRATDGNIRLSGYYRPSEDIDYGLLHEMGHQLGLIDIYQFDLPGEWNLVSGRGYTAIEDLMRSCADFLSPHSAGAMNLWLDQAHGYYGQYLYRIPSELRLRLLGRNGQPLVGAQISMYQVCERPGLGKLITDQVKASGITDANGLWTLPNVPIDPQLVPAIGTGDTLHDNPFGYVAVVGTNGLLHFRVEYQGFVDFAWLCITEANIAYFAGQTSQATFDRQLALGGPIQLIPPPDMAELNAAHWSAWADGSDAQHTYVLDDTQRKVAGQGAIHFVTNGGFDTYVRYPGAMAARWNLSGVQSLKMSVYAVNPHGFQNCSPLVRLVDPLCNYVQYQYYWDGWPQEIFNDAIGTWRSYEIPIDASATEDYGWRRTVVGTPDLTRIQYLEIHVDTWDYGFDLWLDGVGFSPNLSRTDFDRNGAVNSDDYALFLSCFTGPMAGPPATDCNLADLDGDNDVDQTDFGRFQRCFGWPNLPPQSGCQD